MTCGRDVSGLFLTFSNVVNKLLDIKSSGKEVYLIAGNHDYHLLQLKAQDYPFEFLSNWTPLSSAQATASTKSNVKYIFKHGWEFDLAQHPPIMEMMCLNLSDTTGDERTNVYAFLEKARDSFNDILKDIINFHGGNDGYVKNLLQPPEQRLGPYLTDVERKAQSSLNDGERLVFGHTHRPFISDDKRIANAGSWVGDAQIHNTFVEIDDQQLSLWIFKDKNTVNNITDNLIFHIPN